MERRTTAVTPALLDPRTPGDTLAHRYVAGLAGDVSAAIANVSTRLYLLQNGEQTLPVTVDDGAIGGSYVSRPHSAYILYARAELDMVNVGAARVPFLAALGLLDWLLRAANINRVVHLDNWLLSTNLHGDWHGNDLPVVRRLLLDRYPAHLLAIRSLDAWSSPRLLSAARNDGWLLVPSRQVWVTDDLPRDWLPRNAHGNDRRALQRSGLVVEDLTDIGANDAERIAHLYHLLYVGRYSALNPVFTPAFIRHTAHIGMIAYRVARNTDGTIMAVAGMFERNEIMTPPVVGYDTTRPQSEALYRIASFLFMERACERNWRLHGSAGAAHFKKLRGATGVIEYCAFYIRHLSPARQWVMQTLATVLNRLLVPLLQKRGL